MDQRREVHAKRVGKGYDTKAAEWRAKLPQADEAAEMIESELIYYDTAMEYAPNRDALQAAVKGIKMSQQSIVRLRSR